MPDTNATQDLYIWLHNPVELNLTIRPQHRFAVIDIAELIRQQVGDELRPFRKAAYCSFHTTAGYIEQGTSRRLGHSRKQIDPFIRAIQKIFPYNAGYFHDRMQLRDELSEGEKEREPVNADSHLTFIAAGLKNCVTYIHHPEEPVYFIELDGIYKHYVRSRHTAVMAYNRTEIVQRSRVEIPVGGSHAIDAFQPQRTRATASLKRSPISYGSPASTKAASTFASLRRKSTSA